MLGALGTLIGIMVAPLSQMGAYLTMNAATFVANTGTSAAPMSTVSFTAFAMPWINDMGPLLTGTANFMSYLATWFSSLSSFLQTF
jgi:hypothetical protein